MSRVRLRLDLGYDGTDFLGWARQPGRRTVAQVVEDCLATVLRLDAPPVTTVAGRTDAGVHATGQVAHVDVPADAVPDDVEALTRRLAGVLPDDVVVTAVSRAADGFNARFAALGRRYRYRIADRPLDPLRRRDTTAVRRPLDHLAMHRAASPLVGEHDFAAYAKLREGASTVRTLHRLDVDRDQDGVVVVAAEADAFCHNQVRAMVGALLAVGEGRRDEAWPGQVLAAGVRDSAVTVVPAHGLTLFGVDYPPDEQLADRVRTTRSRRG
jgi:tRNA pseudouridine38-40 synthase